MAPIQTVAIIGMGSVGAVFAPRLCAALGHGHFRAIADGARKERLEHRGLTINGKVHTFPVVTPGEPSEPADLVLVAVKRPFLDEALEQIQNQVGQGTVILPLLNGVDCAEKIARIYGENRVLYGFTRVSADMHDGVINYAPDAGEIVFGEKNNEETPRVKLLRELFGKAGIRCQVPEDILHALWYKFMLNVSENLPGALFGLPHKMFQVSEDANAIRTKAMYEVVAVANKQGIALGDEDIQRLNRSIHTRAPGNRSSTQQDIEAGRKTEVDMFAGEMMRQGKRLGVPTPVCEVLYHAIRVLEQKNDGLFDTIP